MSVICLRCNYSITEPLCTSCVISEIKVWLYGEETKEETFNKLNKELNLLSKKMESITHYLFDTRNIEDFQTIECIKCKNEMNLICYYCVNKQASQIIKEGLQNKGSIEKFYESFNTDLYDYSIKKEKNPNLIVF